MGKYNLTVNGVTPDFSRVEMNILKMGGEGEEPTPLKPIRGGLTAINFEYGPDGRENSYGNAPEPVGQVNGKMVYAASGSFKEVTFKKIITELGDGFMRADRQLGISIMYKIDGVTTRVTIVTSFGKAKAGWSEGGELTRDVDFHPTKIRDVDKNGKEIEPM